MREGIIEGSTRRRVECSIGIRAAHMLLELCHLEHGLVHVDVPSRGSALPGAVICAPPRRSLCRMLFRLRGTTAALSSAAAATEGYGPVVPHGLSFTPGLSVCARNSAREHLRRLVAIPKKMSRGGVPRRGARGRPAHLHSGALQHNRLQRQHRTQHRAARRARLYARGVGRASSRQTQRMCVVWTAAVASANGALSRW
jgi:hypothetical protein